MSATNSKIITSYYRTRYSCYEAIAVLRYVLCKKRSDLALGSKRQRVTVTHYSPASFTNDSITVSEVRRYENVRRNKLHREYIGRFLYIMAFSTFLILSRWKPKKIAWESSLICTRCYVHFCNFTSSHRHY